MEGKLPETPVLKEPQGHPAEWFPVQEVNLDNGKLDIRDIHPETLREGKDIPLVSILGFGTGNAALSRTFIHLRDSGEHILGIDFVGGGRGIEGEEGSSTEFNRQGELLYQYLNDYLKNNPQIEQVDFMTQSAGLLKVFALAKLHPEFLPKIRNLIMYSPVGLYEKDHLTSPLRILKRFRDEEKRYKGSERKSELDEENNENLKLANKRMLRKWNPGDVLKAVKEVNALARASAYPTLEVLKATGIGIAVIQGEEDKLASAEMLWYKMGEGYEKPFSMIDTPDGPEYKPNNKKLFTQGISPLTDETINIYQPQNQEPPLIDVYRATSGGSFQEINGEKTVLPGGHGIQVDDPKKAAKTILGTIDYLNKLQSSPIENE